ncbi:MAG: TolC family protein [Acidobacteria bacterium]|nr:TolC family protein [Acidobacteriota bacterium]
MSFALVAWAGCVLALGSALAEGPVEIRLEEALRQGFQNNANVKAREDEISEAEGLREAASELPNPILEMEFETDALSQGAGDRLLSVIVAQPWETAGKRKHRTRAAGHRVEQKREEAEDYRRFLRQQVKSAYLAVVEWQEKVALRQQRIESLERLSDTVKARLEQGEVPASDVDFVRAEAEVAQAEWALAQVNLKNAKAQLQLWMGTKGDEDFRVLPVRFPAIPSLPEERWISLALETRADLSALRLEEQAWEETLKLEKAGAYPNPLLGVGFHQIRAVFGRENVRPVGLLQSIRDTDNLLEFSLKVPLPLFDRNRGNIAATVARQRNAMNRRTFLEQSVRREVQAAIHQAQALEPVGSALESRLVPQARQNLETVENAYGMKLRAINDFISQQRDYFQALEQKVEFQQALQRARAQVEYAVGRELADLAGMGP